MKGYDDPYQKALDPEPDLDQAYLQAVMDGFDLIVQAHKEQAYDTAQRLGIAMMVTEDINLLDVLVTAFLEGMLHYHNLLKDVEPKAAAYMRQVFEDYIESQSDGCELGGEE